MRQWFKRFDNFLIIFQINLTRSCIIIHVFFKEILQTGNTTKQRQKAAKKKRKRSNYSTKSKVKGTFVKKRRHEWLIDTNSIRSCWIWTFQKNSERCCGQKQSCRNNIMKKESEIKKTERGKKVVASGAEKHVIYVYLNPLNFPEEISLVGEAGNG